MGAMLLLAVSFSPMVAEDEVVALLFHVPHADKVNEGNRGVDWLPK